MQSDTTALDCRSYYLDNLVHHFGTFWNNSSILGYPGLWTWQPQDWIQNRGPGVQEEAIVPILPPFQFVNAPFLQQLWVPTARPRHNEKGVPKRHCQRDQITRQCFLCPAGAHEVRACVEEPGAGAYSWSPVGGWLSLADFFCPAKGKLSQDDEAREARGASLCFLHIPCTLTW